MRIDRRQLNALSERVDQLHHESMREAREQFAEVHFGPDLRPARRRFLTQAAAGGAVLAIGSSLVPFGRLVPAALGQEPSGDLALANFAQSVERAAVSAYGAAIETGKLSDTAVGVSEMFADHHDDHANALQAAAADEQVEANVLVLQEFAPMISDAEDEAGILTVAFQIEEAAAATYLFALGEVEDASTAGLLATILPVESQHATVLASLLGTPALALEEAFVSQDSALNPDEFPID